GLWITSPQIPGARPSRAVEGPHRRPLGGPGGDGVHYHYRGAPGPGHGRRGHVHPIGCFAELRSTSRESEAASARASALLTRSSRHAALPPPLRCDAAVAVEGGVSQWHRFGENLFHPLGHHLDLPLRERRERRILP